jgi:hypothetical protein
MCGVSVERRTNMTARPLISPLFVAKMSLISPLFRRCYSAVFALLLPAGFSVKTASLQ